MSENQNQNFLSQEDLEIIKKLREEREAEANFEKIKRDYESDPVKKELWNNVLEARLKARKTKISDKDWLEDMIAITMEGIKSKIANQQKPTPETAEDTPNPIKTPLKPSASIIEKGDNDEPKIDIRNIKNVEELMEKTALLGSDPTTVLLKSIYG